MHVVADTSSYGGKSNKILVLVNPFGGTGRALKIFLEKVVPPFKDANIEYEMISTGQSYEFLPYETQCVVNLSCGDKSWYKLFVWHTKLFPQTFCLHYSFTRQHLPIIIFVNLLSDHMSAVVGHNNSFITRWIPFRCIRIRILLQVPIPKPGQFHYF